MSNTNGTKGNSNKREQAAITAAIDDNNGDSGMPYTLRLAFANGEVITINEQGVTPEIRRYALMHGLKQKLVDAAAIARNPDTGRAASIDDKYAAVKTVYDRLLAGQWNAPREGGGASGGLLLQALIRLYPAKTPESLREYLAGKTDAEKTALRKNPKVASIIETLRAETGKAANIDTDTMLDELERDE